MTSDRKLFIKILNLNCFVTDELGFDELYLVLHGEKIWPEDHLYKSVKKGRTSVNVEIRNLSPNTHLELELWDYDYLSPNDQLGIFPIFIDEPGGSYTTDMIPNSEKTDKAKYLIVWEIDYE
jgi:hypothetical protein